MICDRNVKEFTRNILFLNYWTSSAEKQIIFYVPNYTLYIMSTIKNYSYVSQKTINTTGKSYLHAWPLAFFLYVRHTYLYDTNVWWDQILIRTTLKFKDTMHHARIFNANLFVESNFSNKEIVRFRVSSCFCHTAKI